MVRDTSTAGPDAETEAESVGVARRGPSDPEAVLGFIERYATALAEAGFPRMPARVFAALLTTDSGRLTANQLAQLLRISPGAISGAMRYLIQVNLASRGREPGSRRDVYRLHDDVWYEALLRRDQLLARWDSSLREGVAVLGPETPAGRRLIESLAYVEFLMEELPALGAKWRQRRDELLAGNGDRGDPEPRIEHRLDESA